MHVRSITGVASNITRLLATRGFRYFLLCQTGWFVTVLGAAHRVGWYGVLFAAYAVGYHLLGAARPAREARVVMATVLIGWVWDSGLVYTGLLVYPDIATRSVAPVWIAALWALFAVQLNVLFVWLRGRALLAALVGAVAGPLSFRAGAELGAVVFARPVLAAVALAAGWAVLLPLLVKIASCWDGVAADSPMIGPTHTPECGASR